MIRIFLCTCLFVILSACASLKELDPFEQLKPIDSEPRVSFVVKQKVSVQPSELPKVKPSALLASYRRLLDRGNPSIRKEALRRLADLTMQFAELNLTAEPGETLDPAIQASTFAEAISLYEQLLREFPNYQYAADIKYQLARAYALNSQPEQSLGVLDQIAVKYEKADTYVETQFRRGESYFARQKFRTAEQAYSQVIEKGKNTEFYDKALYKRGWALFKQNLYEEALDDFFLLMERLIKNRQQNIHQTKQSDELINDTHRVISLSFYNMEGPVSIRDYFAKNGPRTFESQVFESLAKLYLSQERFTDAADTYQVYIDRNPLAETSPTFHTRIIEIYRKGGFPSLILPAKQSFVENYGRQSAFWKKHQHTSIMSSVLPQLKSHLVDIARFYHAEAQKSKKPEDYLKTSEWYEQILLTFDDPKVDSQYRFALAETLQAAGRIRRAAKEYETVAYKNKASKYSRDAGYRALVAWEQIKYPKSASKIERLSPSILSGQKFAKSFPRDPKAAEILARVAEQQLETGDINGAVESSNQLLVLPAKATQKQIDRALIIIANGLFDLGKFAEAEIAIDGLLKQGKLTRQQRKNFRQRRAEAIYKQAETAKANNEMDKAITLFTKIYTTEPTSTVAINAQYDAATLLLQQKNFEQAASILRSFRKKYPKHQLSKTIPEKLAYIYEEQKDWSKAAVEYQVLADNQKDKNLAREAYWHIADLYLKSGDKKRAIVAFKKYAWDYPEPYLLAQEARQKLVDLYLQTGDSAKANFWRTKIVQFHRKAGKKNNERTNFLAADAKFALSEPLYQAYKRIKLKLPLAKSLKKKKAAMQKALKSYQAIAHYRVAKFTTASTQRIASMYQILSTDLMNSQRPKGMSEEELEEYGYLLEEKAIPFEDKAIELFEVNAERTAAGIYDEFVKSSINALKKLKPAQYDKTEELADDRALSF